MAIANLINQPATHHSISTASTPKPEVSPCASRLHTSFPIAQPDPRQTLETTDYGLEIRQQPLSRARNSLVARPTVIPSPIIQLEIHDGDPDRKWLQSPCFFMCANLYHPALNMPIRRPPNETLAGGIVSSLHLVGDLNRGSGYFIFDELTIKIKGEFRLRFILFEILEYTCLGLSSTTSDVFRVYSSHRSPEFIDHTLLSPKYLFHGPQTHKENEDRTASVVQCRNPTNNTIVSQPMRPTMVSHAHPMTDRMPSSLSTIVAALQTTDLKLS
ncbi:velvet factor-domain-containing protein [Lipomyces doorenjongii]